MRGVVAPDNPPQGSISSQDSEGPRPTFEELTSSPALLRAVADQGWTLPTPIQVKAIPAAREGRDVVGIAQTGTGKTGAFMIPALEGIGAGDGLQVLVLCPTRELAQQVADDTHALAAGTRIRSLAIYWPKRGLSP